MGPIRIALCACWLIAGIIWQNCAIADDRLQLLEEVIVTGTRIARPNLDAASPIVVVQAVEFQRTSSSTAETTLNQYPQFAPGYTGTSNNRGNLNAYSEGRAGLNLRGLGDNRTLTLVDGRRLTPVNANGETDLNVIPPALIESVDVITGGASAVYGSDAIAGVVNFRLRHDFEGVEFGGRWGQTDHGDGEEYDVSLTAGTGFADGRGSIVGYVGYYDRAQINQSAREFARATCSTSDPTRAKPAPPMPTWAVRHSPKKARRFWAVRIAGSGCPGRAVRNLRLPGRDSAARVQSRRWVQHRWDVVHDRQLRAGQRRKLPRSGRSLTSNSFFHGYNFAISWPCRCRSLAALPMHPRTSN